RFCAASLKLLRFADRRFKKLARRSSNRNFRMENFLRALPTRPRSPVVRYLITAAIVVFCFAAVMGMHGISGLLGFYLLFPAIFVSSVVFDRACGIFASVLSTVLLYLLMKPAGSLFIPNELIAPLLLFLVEAAALAVFSEALRAAWDRAFAA